MHRHMLTRAHTIMCVYIHLEGPPLLSLSSVTCVSVDEPANDLHWQIATSVDRMVDYTHTHTHTQKQCKHSSCCYINTYRHADGWIKVEKMVQGPILRQCTFVLISLLAAIYERWYGKLSPKIETDVTVTRDGHITSQWEQSKLIRDL